MTRRRFEGRTVLVTGAGGGLGRALCRRFAAAGAQIAALDVDRQALEELTDELRDRGTKVTAEVVDLADEARVAEAVGRVEQELGPVYCAVANAGITHLASFARDQAPSVRRVMEVNFFGAVHPTAACFDSVVKQEGLFVGISSVAGYAPLLGRTAYCASKHALHGFYDTLRLELRRTGAGVLLVCPSFIDTGIRRRFENDGQTGDESPNEAGRGRTVGPAASPEHVADRIFDAAAAGRRELHVGAVGHFSRWCRRLAPRLYEHLMLRTIRDEP